MFYSSWNHSRSEVGGPVAPAIAGPSLARLLYRGGDWRYAAYNKQLLKMETNKKEPLSLRTIGAFTVSGAELFKNETELKEWTISELEEIIDNYLEHFYKTAQSSSICDFYNNLENSIYHVELRKALSLIHEHKYQGALDYLKDKGEGIFKNGDVSINNAIREYCINQLS